MRAISRQSLLILTFSILLSTSYGEGSGAHLVETTQREALTVQTQKPSPITPGYNASARPEVQNSWDFFLSGSFIYWNPSQSNMDLGTVSNLIDPTFYLDGKVSKMDFDYHPGFKLGLGVKLDRDQWDLFLQYTRFHSSDSSKVSLDPTGSKILYPSWLVPLSLIAYYDGQEKWKLQMDFIDLELARQYFVGQQLAFRSSFGLRAALIDQDAQIDYTNVTNSAFNSRNHTSVHQSSDSWAIGPRAGLDTNWLLGKGFKIFGDGTLDILYTDYTKMHLKQESRSTTGELTTGSIIQVKEKSDQQLRTHLDLEIGLGWDSSFLQNSMRTNLSIGYQFQVFFDQNMFRSLVDDQALGKGDSPHGNLYIQGLNITLGFDF